MSLVMYRHRRERDNKSMGIKFSEKHSNVSKTVRERDVSEDGDDADESDVQSSDHHRLHRRSRTEIDRIYFGMINDRIVDEVTIEFFYRPHTITVLVVICGFLLIPAFTRDERNTENNAFAGIIATCILFLVVSTLAFPNGPFIRPHPVIWRTVFGCSVIYMLILQFALFQSFADVKSTLRWLDPQRLNRMKIEEKAYAVNCSDITLGRIWGYMDIFAVSHFLGWALKALLIRHSIICWYISISWELTEVFFAHLLPNFQECWWDAIILDILLCNGLGIFFGTQLCKFFEMRSYHWESMKDIKTTRGKIKRAVLQFTPESWIRVNWYNSFAFRRILAIYAFVMLWLVSELNTFFLKHIFAVDTSHPLVFWRIVLIAFCAAPSIRQFYLFVTDPRVKRLGMQGWVYLAICALEAAVCFKFGRHQFPMVNLKLLTLWITFMAVGTLGCVLLSAWWAKKSSITKPVEVDGHERLCYLDSSNENLGAIADDVKFRRRKLKFSESDFN